MGNRSLHAAKRVKNDEFYTRYDDIARELGMYPAAFLKDKVVYCNTDDYQLSSFVHYLRNRFDDLQLRVLIATGHLRGGRGSLYIKTREATEERVLKDDGDFRSPECVELLKMADVVITNPPFSLFREFMAQLLEHGKRFLVLGNMNAITYKEIFPAIKEGRLWLGTTNGARTYDLPGGGSQTLGNTVWFTNLEHGKRPEPMELMPMAWNLKWNKKLRKKSDVVYKTYDNYDAIEVPYVDAIPSDYDGVMGVPISFLDKFCPEQFEILGSQSWAKGPELEAIYTGDRDSVHDDKSTLINGKETYARVFIRRKK